MLFSADRLVPKNVSYGSIEVICGSMFSGKTEELIRRTQRAQLSTLAVSVFKPAMDTRYHQVDVTSHDSTSMPSTPVDHSSTILLLAGAANVVAIDEAQFLDNGLPDVCNFLANEGVRVMVAGLDMDFKGRPFGPVPALMAIAEKVTKLHATCARCGAQANYSHRITQGKQKLILGEKDHYEPRCRACFFGTPKH